MDHDEPLPVIWNRSQSRSITTAIAITESSNGYQNNVIYDVPSSDEHSAAPFPIRAGSSSKRRKPNPVDMEEYSSVVWDDESLQKHIAAETAICMGKRMKSFGTHTSSTASVGKLNASTTSKRKDPFTRAPRVVRNSVLGNVPTETALGLPVRPGIVDTKPVSPNKAQHEMSLMPQAAIACPENSPSSLKGTRIKHVGSSASTLKKRSKPVVLNTSGPSSSSLLVPKENPDNANGTSVPTNLVSTHRPEVEEPTARIGIQGPTPKRLEIFSFGALSSEGLSYIPYVYRNNKHQARGLIHTSPSPTRLKIKDRLHTSRKPPALFRKASSETGSDSEREPLSRSPSSGKSHTGHKISSQEAVSSDCLANGGSQSLSSTRGSNSQIGALKVTYGHQRSFLTEEHLDKAFSTYTPACGAMRFRAATNRAHPRNDFSEAQKLPVLSEAMDDSIGANTSAIRSIHELREAGGNARISGDIEATLDDIDEKNGVPLSLRRSGLLEIATKLRQPEFCRRFTDLGLETRLLAHVDSCSDTIAGMLLLATMLQIIAHPNSSHSMAEFATPTVLKFLGKYLECHEGLRVMARSRKSNMSKILQAEVAAFCASFILADVWRSGQPAQITGHILSLQCLEYIARHQREAGSTSDILSYELIENLTKILIPSPNPVVLTLENGPPAEVQLSLSILESWSIAHTKCLDGQDMWWGSTSIARMTEFLSIIQRQTGPQVGTLRTLALRLCLNLTNNNSTICHAFSNPKVILATLSMIGSSFSTLTSESGGESTEIVVDNLVLSLGLLINLVEWNERVRELFLLNDDNQPNPLSTLSEIFESNIDETSEVRVFALLNTKCADQI